MSHAADIPFLDLPAQHQALHGELVAAFERALATAGFIGGPEVAGFESEFAAFCGPGLTCAGTGNGTDALRQALQALGVGRGDLAMTVPNTFIATTEAISHVGADFAFVDVEPDTGPMDMALLERELLRRKAAGERLPRVVVPVHLYGQMADMATLMALAERFGFLVLEDAAQAHGASRDGHRPGQLGHAAAFSFYPGKNLGACGEAGAVVSRLAEVTDTVRILRDHGQKEKYLHRLEGMNGRLDAIQAAFLRVKLPLLEGWNQRRRDIAARYDQAFAGLPWLAPVAVRAGAVPSRHLYVVHAADRQALADFLRAGGVHTGLHYPMPLHLQECYAHRGQGPGSLPVAEGLANRLLSLPIFPEMTDDQAGRVISRVLEYGQTGPAPLGPLQGRK